MKFITKLVVITTTFFAVTLTASAIETTKLVKVEPVININFAQSAQESVANSMQLMQTNLTFSTQDSLASIAKQANTNTDASLQVYVNKLVLAD